MKFKILTAALILTAFISCQSPSAFKYNQDFVAKEKLLTPEIVNTETEVAKFANAQQWDSVSAVATRMENKVQAQISDIEKTPAPDAKGGEKFKLAALRYFNYMKSMYTSYRKVGEATTQEARASEVQTMQHIITQKEAAARDIREAQAEYAKANNFKIES